MTQTAVSLIGAGPGDPGLITVHGLACLRRADVVIYDHLVSPRLLLHARRGAELIDVGASAPQPLEQQAISYLIAEKAREGKLVARLKWGDPFVFDHGGEEALFLQEHGFEVTSAKGLGYERVPEGAATQEILFNLGADAYANSRKADALVVSCGALRTLDLIVPLEDRIKVPVVSSTPHGLMNGVRLLGVNPRAQGFGMVFSRA